MCEVCGCRMVCVFAYMCVCWYVVLGGGGVVCREDGMHVCGVWVGAVCG